MSDEPLSAIESALLRVFQQQGARAGQPLPVDVLVATVSQSGLPVLSGALETALLNLQFRGVIAPGPDPISAFSWMLTHHGEKIIRSAEQAR